MRLSAALLLSLGLAGCAVPRSVTTVEPVRTAALGLDGPRGQAASHSAVRPDWWREFGDPQLARLVDDALAGNPSLDVALARVAQARAGVAARGAELGPEVAFNGEAQVARLSGRFTIPPPFAGSTRFVGTTLANLDWNLDLFGRQRVAIEGARASLAAAGIDLAAARLTIAGAVASTYLDLARAEAQASISGRTVAAREASLRLVDARIRNRLAGRLDREAVATLLAQARQAAIRAAGDATLARNALAALAGRGADYSATIGATSLRLDALALPPALPADLLGRRPDIAAAAARVAAAGAGSEVARRAWYPNVNLRALAGFQAIGIGNLLSLDARSAAAGPAISLPLFDRGRRRADLAAADASRDLAVADYNDRVLGAVREAADALVQVDALTGDRARQAEVVRGYRETGRLNAIRVSSGLDSRLDLVDNDVRTLEAEQTDAALAVAVAQARVRLAVALGGGFAAPSDNQP